jgi:hypothetical protein
MLRFTRHSRAGTDVVEVAPDALVIAGWAGRDEAALKHHIEELAAIGVPRPSSVPVFYRCAASILTQGARLEVLGGASSGEVEPVIVALPDGLWLTVGSDHTDRAAETHGIALSKQMCGKPVAGELWRLDEVAEHWDAIEIASHAVIEGERVAYQAGTLAALRPPADLIARWRGGSALAPGTVMFGGTLGAIGGIRPASRFEMTLTDRARGRTIHHAYDVVALPVVS